MLCTKSVHESYAIQYGALSDTQASMLRAQHAKMIENSTIFIIVIIN